MEIQQIFWQKKISPQEVLVDWDTFITKFEEYLMETISIRINQVQKQYIKSLIDPQNREQVYKNSYLLFMRDFWDLPSNRTKLLKGQLNLSKLPRFKFAMDSQEQSTMIIRLSYLVDKNTQCQQEGKDINNFISSRVYQWKGSKIYALDRNSQLIQQKKTNYNGFLTIGRGSNNDIPVINCKHMNHQHIKLVRRQQKYNQQKKPIFSMDLQKKMQQETVWYIKDTSKSNRLRYSLNDPHKHVIVKNGMVINFGIIDQYQLHIQQATSQQISKQTLKQIQQLLNQNRINYLGQIDPSIPEKTMINIPNGEIKHSDIEMWFHKGYKYGEPQKSNGKQSKTVSKRDDEVYPLKVSLFNKVTQKKQSFKFLSAKVTVGRNKNSDISINNLKIRDQECTFVCQMGCWILKNNSSNFSNLLQEQKDKKSDKKKLQKKLQIQDLSVKLPILSCIDKNESSNRVRLNSKSSHSFVGNKFMVDINFSHPELN